MKNSVKRRKIKVIWHFTRLSNLDGILRHGLKGRHDLEEQDLSTEINDPYRYDYQENAICCSISHPNYKMFYALRQGNPDIKWVVIGLNKSILWKKDCAFCVSNAASGDVTCIPVEDRKGMPAFNKLFEEISNKPTRQELGISGRCPTNPQAEVLVLESIEPKYILGVVTHKRDIESALTRKYPRIDVRYNTSAFSYRLDYEHWR